VLRCRDKLIFVSILDVNYAVLLQVGQAEGRRGDTLRQELPGDVEYRVDELTLGYGSAFADPADLPLGDCIHRLVALNRSPRPVGLTETEASRDPLLDEAMVLLEDVIRKCCNYGSGSVAV
jgi:hypothetical protein